MAQARPVWRSAYMHAHLIRPHPNVRASFQRSPVALSARNLTCQSGRRMSSSATSPSGQLQSDKANQDDSVDQLSKHLGGIYRVPDVKLAIQSLENAIRKDPSLGDKVISELITFGDHNASDDATISEILLSLSRILTPDAAGRSLASNHKSQLVSLLTSVLEGRRRRRKEATVQSLQKNEWNDGNVFAAASHVFKALDPLFETEKLLKDRTEFSRAKRLMIFSPPQDGNTLHNVKPYIAEMAQRNLLQAENDHPLAMLASVIRNVFADFDHFGANVDPVVTTKQCFDDLLVPHDHVSRKPSDTFYFREGIVLRAHTSAHQTEFLARGYEKFLVSGDVYRRDEIDKTHFPVFHQMEGVKVLPPGSTKEQAFEDLKTHLNKLADVLFPGMPRKWIDAYFPFTDPSLELEIDFKGKPVELLGCGVVQTKILESCGLKDRVGWAFGLGLERLAMILFQIPDIRLFWSEDKRFLDQFVGCKTKFESKRKVPKFKQFSKYPPSRRDVSFWLPVGKENTFHVNDFFSIVREVAGDDVEEVSQFDAFVGPDGRHSKAFRMVFRSDFRTLTGTEVNEKMNDIAKRLIQEFNVQIR